MDRSSKALTISVLVGVILGIGLIFGGISSVNEATEVPLSSIQPISTPLLQASSPSATLGVEGQSANVLKVVDGDTIEVEYGGKSYKLRYIGIDTPETVDPRRPVGCFGKEASNENKNLVGGKNVVLQKDISDMDKYGRLLRYVYLPLSEGKFLFVNDHLVRNGFAKVSNFPPDVKFTNQFLDAQKEAQENSRGLWGSCR